jgi:TfoX/Sxy family transcriptional regulator of competence genes
MKWVKAPEELKKLLEDVMENIDCEKRPMFGYPAYFINRNMFAGLFQDQLFVRLSADQLTSYLKKYPSIRNLEPMAGRPMKNYYVLPRDLYLNPKSFKEAMKASAEYTQRLPAKEKVIKTKPPVSKQSTVKSAKSKAPRKKA